METGLSVCFEMLLTFCHVAAPLTSGRLPQAAVHTSPKAAGDGPWTLHPKVQAQNLEPDPKPETRNARTQVLLSPFDLGL